MDLAVNLAAVQSRITTACARAGRDPSSVTLLAVSKGQPPEQVRSAADLGLRLFGENKVQEGKLKVGQCPASLRWHMIGHLQSNKCRDAVAFFAMVEGVDSLALAEDLNRWAERAGKTLPILLEVNIAGESSKFGLRPESVREVMLAANALSRLELHGFMTIAPWSPDPERARPVFRRLREIQQECEQALGAPLPVLSMGMSGDLEVAIEEGATLVRVGTALFGERPRPLRPPA